MMRFVFLSFLLVFPVFSAAQGGIELTPTAGMRWGGELNTGYGEIFGVDVKVKDSASFGLVFDVDLNRWLFLELMADHQSSELGTGRICEPPEVVAHVDVDYYHIGLGWQWHMRTLRPFVISSIGWTTISPDLPGLRDESRFSMSLGGGLKVDFNKTIGLRLELRTFWTDTSDENWWDNDDWWDDDCNNHGCDDDWNGFNDFAQAQIKVGLIIKF